MIEKTEDLLRPFWSDLATSSEFWSAITGAIVGGLIALGVQMVSLKAAERQRKDETKEKRKALGHALLFKMIQIHSHLKIMHTHMEECFAEAKRRKLSSEAWATFLPLANFPELVSFTTDEMSFLLSLHEDDLFNQIISFDEVHNSIVELFKLHARLRAELLSQLPSTMNGSVGSVSLASEEVRKVRPKMVELNDLIGRLQLKVEQEAKLAQTLTFSLNSVLQRTLGINIKLEIKKYEDKLA